MKRVFEESIWTITSFIKIDSFLRYFLFSPTWKHLGPFFPRQKESRVFFYYFFFFPHLQKSLVGIHWPKNILSVALFTTAPFQTHIIWSTCINIFWSFQATVQRSLEHWLLAWKEPRWWGSSVNQRVVFINRVITAQIYGVMSFLCLLSDKHCVTMMNR